MLYKWLRSLKNKHSFSTDCDEKKVKCFQNLSQKLVGNVEMVQKLELGNFKKNEKKCQNLSLIYSMISQQDIMILVLPFFQFALPAHSTIHSMYYSVFLKCDYIIIIAKIINEKEKWNFELFFPPTTHQSGFTLIGKMMSLKRNKKKNYSTHICCVHFL